MTNSAPQSRPNPARLLEVFAVRTVQGWVGGRGAVTDTGGAHGPDFRIEYHEGRLGLGEVGWHQDRNIQKMWEIIFDQKEHQVVRLPAGYGFWSVGFARIPRMKSIASDLPRLIKKMIGSGARRLDVVSYFPRGEVPEEARNIGLEYVVWHADTPDAVVYFPPNPLSATALGDPEAVPRWIEAVLAEPAHEDTSGKLKSIKADEKHIFLMTGAGDDFSVLDGIQRVVRAPPSRAPAVPSWITHVWGVAQFGGDHAVLWSRETGWEAVPVPPPIDPDTIQ